MINRVTNTGVSAAAQRNLLAAMAGRATVQEKASSLQEISRPSDDPAGAADAMAVRRAATRQRAVHAQRPGRAAVALHGGQRPRAPLGSVA
ncbi:MAG: hypothetical protein ABWX68_07075 [Arthrobacter sp.]|uniref:hypothetical protein n=1 Tax=Arthrobacter sp. TaxID=1667 RepID=UPI003472EEBD